MEDFKKEIRATVKGIGKSYESRDIYIKENNNTGQCIAHFRKGIEQIGDSEFRRFLINIENQKDIISYREIMLPGGRYKKISGQGDDFSLYNFNSMFQALYGEKKSPFEMITEHDINQLISLYETQRQSMRYYEFEEVRCKGKAAYIGRYLESGAIIEKELLGDVFLEECGWDWKRIDDGSRRILINSRCLKEFSDQKHNLKFSESTLQNIVERNKSIEIE